MATIKSYTDISQSKTLSKILLFESADMYYKYALPKSDRIIHTPEIGNPIDSLKWYNEGYTFRGKREPITLSEYCIPCWSLAALLSVLPFHLIINNQRYAFSMHKGLDKDGETYMLRYNVFNTDVCLYSTDYYGNPVDACVVMIEKLHELKTL